MLSSSATCLRVRKRSVTGKKARRLLGSLLMSWQTDSRIEVLNHVPKECFSGYASREAAHVSGRGGSPMKEFSLPVVGPIVTTLVALVTVSTQSWLRQRDEKHRALSQIRYLTEHANFIIAYLDARERLTKAPLPEPGTSDPWTLSDFDDMYAPYVEEKPAVPVALRPKEPRHIWRRGLPRATGSGVLGQCHESPLLAFVSMAVLLGACLRGNANRKGVGEWIGVFLIITRAWCAARPVTASRDYSSGRGAKG